MDPIDTQSSGCCLRIICLDPASNKFGIVGIEFLQVDMICGIRIYMHHLLTSPQGFVLDDKTRYMGHALAGLVAIDKPDLIVSEKPWGAGFSITTLANLLGSIKASIWEKIEWQGVSEARKTVLGDGFGGEKKRPTAEWLLSYPWDTKSKNLIKGWLDSASPDTDDGYDELDAVLHGLCYLIKEKGLTPVHKEPKVKKRGKKNV